MGTRTVIGCVLLLVCVSVHAQTPSPVPVCIEAYEAPTKVGRLPATILSEVSGVAPSTIHTDRLWMHNDSGDSARLVAVDTVGRFRGELHLKGVTNTDFEDMASARCPETNQGCLWVADTGNNLVVRDTFHVHVVPEPRMEGPAGTPVVRPVTTLAFRYPEEPVDSEALLVAADGLRFWTIEKTARPSSRIYEYAAPFVPGQVIEMIEVGRLPVPGMPVRFGQLISGADFHPTGMRLLIRVYSGVYEYRLSSPWNLGSLDALSPLRVVAGPFSEPQGEAVSYDATGMGLWTVSEDRTGVGRQP